MFLEYWMIGILMIVWIAGMLHMQKVGFEEGWSAGTNAGVQTTFRTLERHGILNEEVFEDLAKKVAEEQRNITKIN